MTIRRWHADGSLLPDFITKGGHRRDDTNRVKTIFEPSKDERMTIGYCRVSSSDQISDLETQKLVIEHEIASKKNSTIICDKGSGINFKKRGLLDLLKRIMAGEVSEVIVTHKDAAANIKQRADDTEISLYMPHKDVKKILLDRLAANGRVSSVKNCDRPSLTPVTRRKRTLTESELPKIMQC